MPLTRIQSLGITDGTIVNADINASAAIDGTKLTGVGKVLQVIQSTVNTQESTTSTSYQNSNLTVTITPSSASNKILLFVSAVTQRTAGRSLYSILRSTTSTNIHTSGNGLMAIEGSNVNDNLSFVFLDSPSTTSAITYTLQYRNETEATTYMFAGNVTNVMLAQEIKS
jgi:hypothetical protein